MGRGSVEDEDYDSEDTKLRDVGLDAREEFVGSFIGTVFGRSEVDQVPRYLYRFDPQKTW